MALTRGFGQNSLMTPLDSRFFTAGLLQKNIDNSVRLGQLWGSSVSSVASTATMAVTIPDGSYWVASRATGDGAVVLASVGTTSVTLPAAPASNSRYDVVWLKQNDSTQGDADSLPTFGYTSGTAAASPVVPTAPTGALVLAQVLVPSGVTATNAGGVVITNVYKFAAVLGAPIRYRSATEMIADTSNVVGGSLAYVRDSATYVLRSGSWLRLDADTFAVIQQQTATAFASSSTPATMGGSGPSAATSDTVLMPVTGGNVIGPLPLAGWYECVGNVQWASNSTGNRYIELMQNDASIVPAAATLSAGSAGTNQSVTSLMSLAAGDYVKLKGYQNSGGSLNYQSRLSVRLVRPS